MNRVQVPPTKTGNIPVPRTHTGIPLGWHSDPVVSSFTTRHRPGRGTASLVSFLLHRPASGRVPVVPDTVGAH